MKFRFFLVFVNLVIVFGEYLYISREVENKK